MAANRLRTFTFIQNCEQFIARIDKIDRNSATDYRVRSKKENDVKCIPLSLSSTNPVHRIVMEKVRTNSFFVVFIDKIRAPAHIYNLFLFSN